MRLLPVSFARTARLLLLLSFPLFSSPARADTIVERLRRSRNFTVDLLPLVETNGSITEATSIAADAAGNLYVLGEVETLNSSRPDPNFPLPAQPSTDSSTGGLGGTDIFVLRLNAGTGRAEWRVRLGSAAHDRALAIVFHSPSAAVYVAAHVKAPLPNGGAGAAMYRLDAASGQVAWSQTYGSLTGEEVFADMAPYTDTELVVVGQAGQRTMLIAEGLSSRVTSAVLICRMQTGSGDLTRCATAAALPSTSFPRGLSVMIKRTSEGVDRAFIGGDLLKLRSGKEVRNTAMYVFRLPELRQVGANLLDHPRKEDVGSVVGSMNPHSVYLCGSTYMSVYEETDGFLRRLNATAGLARGWNASVGSIRFSHVASVRDGEAREQMRDCAVDDNGNVVALLDSTGELPQAGPPTGRRNQRPAVVVVAPNGTVVMQRQAQLLGSIATRKMVLLEQSVVVYAGSRLDERVNMMQAAVGGVALSNAPLPRMGEEFQPSALLPESNGETEEAQKTSNLLILSAALAGSAVGIAVLVVCVCVLVSRRKSSTNT